MSRDPLLVLEDLENAARRVVRYTEGMERDAVFADEMRFDAVLYNLHVIGEAVKHLPEALRRKHEEMPWREIAGMRDFIAHAYFALDLDILWDAIRNDVPDLLWVRLFWNRPNWGVASMVGHAVGLFDAAEVGSGAALGGDVELG